MQPQSLQNGTAAGLAHSHNHIGAHPSSPSRPSPHLGGGDDLTPEGLPTSPDAAARQIEAVQRTHADLEIQVASLERERQRLVTAVAEKFLDGGQLDWLLARSSSTKSGGSNDGNKRQSPLQDASSGKRSPSPLALQDGCPPPKRKPPLQ